MDYHSDRFEDYSLMIFRSEELVAIVPANIKSGIVYSHQGLTYGGMLVASKSKFKDTLDCFQAVLKFLSSSGVAILKWKRLPRVYNTLPSDGIDYLLFKTNAERERCDLSMVIDLLSDHSEMSTNRKRNLKKAKANIVSVKETSEFDAFFNSVLIPNLKEKHQSSPTHSASELDLLKSKFPDHIRQFNAYHNDKLIAGVTVFITETVVHAQYISTVDSKRHLGGLDVIFDHLLHFECKGKRYFSFGISNENQGQQINEGLLHWKSSFGAHPIVHEFYSVDTANYTLLNDVWI